MGNDKRADERYKVGLAARLSHAAAGSRAVTVTNVSSRGCRFNWSDDPLEPGTGLTMSFGRVGSLEAKVAWRVGPSCGVRFEQALDPVKLDHIRLFLSEEPALVAERGAGADFR